MGKEVKTIGILTSGGDAPGMNAAIRAVARSAIHKGIRVMGIRRGYNGLINNDMFEMDLRSVSDILQRGGTTLYTARCLEFKEMSGVLRAKETCEKVGIDGLVVMGGDGSFRGAKDLSNVGIPTIGIPCTIDNDIAASDYTIGFDTAMNTAMEMVDRLRDTSQSHDRCSVVEVMGRHAGFIALNTGIAVGATAILIPEKEYDFDRDVIDVILAHQKTGKQNFVIVVAEGIGHVYEMAKAIEEKTGIESRATVLGHVQRGGSPTVRDRVVASEMGYYAVELVSKGIGNRVVCLKDDKIVDYEINEALEMKKTIDSKEYEIAKIISL